MKLFYWDLDTSRTSGLSEAFDSTFYASCQLVLPGVGVVVRARTSSLECGRFKRAER